MKSLEKMMEDLNDPGTVELNARYQNARDAVSWAYKMAQDMGGDTVNIIANARGLIPSIENDLNKTLEVLDGTKAKST